MSTPDDALKLWSAYRGNDLDSDGQSVLRKLLVADPELARQCLDDAAIENLLRQMADDRQTFTHDFRQRLHHESQASEMAQAIRERLSLQRRRLSWYHAAYTAAAVLLIALCWRQLRPTPVAASPVAPMPTLAFHADELVLHWGLPDERSDGLQAITMQAQSWAPSDDNQTPRIRLNWDDATGSDTISYRVYRATSKPVPTSPSHRIASKLTSSEFIDTDVRYATSYYYAVTAVNKAGLESLPSNTAACCPPEPETSSVIRFCYTDQRAAQRALDTGSMTWDGHKTKLMPTAEPHILEMRTHRSVMLGNICTIDASGHNALTLHLPDHSWLAQAQADLQRRQLGNDHDDAIQLMAVCLPGGRASQP